MKIFIDDTGWVQLINPAAEHHDVFEEAFQQMLNQGDSFFTHNISIGMAFDTLKNNLNLSVAFKFYETIEEAYTGTHLHILWVGRKTQREAVRLMRKHPELDLNLYDYAAYMFMNRRRIRNIFTTKASFQELGLKVLPGRHA